MSRTFHIRTFGCQMNEHDSERIAGLLVADGLEPAVSAESADVIVFNTCCIRENADNKLYGELGRLKPHLLSRPGTTVAVAGCLAQKDGELVRRRAPHVDVVFGTHNLERAPALLRLAERSGPVVEILDAPAPAGADDAPGSAGVPADAALQPQRSSRHSAWVTVQVGCDNSCAFCIVPSVRGREVSRPFEELVAEVTALAHRGVSEVTLLG
ncbi:MAG TPA: tRNA (N6-isopentenyl adenosine(37)-C2)-methylthiotransferase MiaB, partial [Acidimicrobiaceae bacterium]|nr:tRNA (N6-isopentenyl adenosine(37)-C2)-methylthiotransferase MiaB [Acidimicrobiaceae bacterium]